MADEIEKTEAAAEPVDAARQPGWDAAATSEDELAPADGATTERVLNQEEIESPLGFDVDDEDLQDKSGVRAIINSTLVSYERLPMLEIVFDRLVRLMTTSLRHFTSDH